MVRAHSHRPRTAAAVAVTVAAALNCDAADPARTSFIELVDAWHRHGHGKTHFTNGMGLHFYLAQTPIVAGSSCSSDVAASDSSNESSNATSGSEAAPLAYLQQDIKIPAFVEQCVSIAAFIACCLPALQHSTLVSP